MHTPCSPIRSPLCDLWLFWTNPRLTCQSGINVQTPLAISILSGSIRVEVTPN